MKHHYIVYAMMKYDAVCRFGAVCTEDELRSVLKRKNIVGYKLISVDDEQMDGWKEKDWIQV